jgi:hypothetical protein
MKSHEYKGGGAILDKPTGGRQGKVSVCVWENDESILYAGTEVYMWNLVQ